MRPLNQAPLFGYLYSNYGLTDAKKGRSWAVVTGGSDGIGFSMCKKLANEGFNICMVARNEEKMKEKIGELRKQVHNQNFATKYIVADFSKLTTIEHYK